MISELRLPGLTALIQKIIEDARARYLISDKSALVILFLPIVIVMLYLLMFIVPSTRHVALWSLEENRPVEIITFVSFLCAALQGFNLTIRFIGRAGHYSIISFCLIFSLLLLVVAFEEIAWGQTIFGFETPAYWRNINAQGETTLHNITGLQGHSEIFRLIFGVGGFVGMGLWAKSGFNQIASPFLLIFWLSIITIHATIDVFNDYIPIQRDFDYLMQRTSELIEMMIGLCAFLYMYLNNRKITSETARAEH